MNSRLRKGTRLLLLMLTSFAAWSCRTTHEIRSDTEADANVELSCADPAATQQRRGSDLMGQRAAAVRSRECLKQIASRLRRVLEAPRPCDHDTIGANPYLCPTLEMDGQLLSVTVEGLLWQVDLLAKQVDDSIGAGAIGDTSLIDTALRLEGAIGRTESRVRLLDEDLHQGIWGWLSCPGDDGGTTSCACSPSSTCAVWTDGPPPDCTCIRGSRGRH